MQIALYFPISYSSGNFSLGMGSPTVRAPARLHASACEQRWTFQSKAALRGTAHARWGLVQVPWGHYYLRDAGGFLKTLGTSAIPSEWSSVAVSVAPPCSWDWTCLPSAQICILCWYFFNVMHWGLFGLSYWNIFSFLFVHFDGNC